MSALLAKVKEDILKDFPQAFGDKLTKGINPTAEPVKLEIEDSGGNPVNFGTARRCPANLELDSNDHIKELLEADVIEEVFGSSRWCTRGAFIPKEKGGVRLVVNFQPLNKYSKRAGWSFASTEHIKGNLRTDSKLFWTLDKWLFPSENER